MKKHNFKNCFKKDNKLCKPYKDKPYLKTCDSFQESHFLRFFSYNVIVRHGGPPFRVCTALNLGEVITWTNDPDM